MGFSLNENLGVNIPLNEKIWVGYYAELRVFEYVGKYTHIANINVSDC